MALLLPTLSLLLWSCGASNEFVGLGAEADFQNGKELFERGRCFRAVETLRTFLSEHPGSARVDDAMFYLGRSHKCLDENLLARDEFDRVLREFPQSEHREEAEWQRALTFYDSRHKPDRDPVPTEDAIVALQNYLRNYPSGVHREEGLLFIRDSRDRLARKDFENGTTYSILRQWDAAIVYFKLSLETLEDSSVAARSLAGIVRAYTEKGEPEEATSWLERFQRYATPERVSRHSGLPELLEKATSDVERAPAVRDRLERERQKRQENGD